MTRLIQIILCIALTLGCVVAQAYVVGFEYHRFFTPSWFFLIAAVLLCFQKPLGQGKWQIALLVALLLVSVYLGGRGMLSDVPLMAGKDYPVFFYGLLAFLGMIALARSQGLFKGFIVFAMGMHAYQLLIALTPDTFSAGLPQAWGTLASGASGHGFFRHYNPFASYCAISLAFLVGLLFIKFQSARRALIFRVVVGALAVLTAWAAIESGSRLGATATLMAGFFCVVLGAALRYLYKRGRLRSVNALRTTTLVVIVGMFLSMGLFFIVFNKMSDQRGMTGDLDSDLMQGLRVNTIGLGYEFWQQEPIIGNGPRSYWYRVPAMRGEPTSGVIQFNDPEMVHNDYIQTLAEYGVVGLVLVLGAVIILVHNIWRLGYRLRFVEDSWVVPAIMATSALGGIMVHALADFTPHNVAVFVPLSLVLGGSYGYLLAAEQRSGFARAKVHAGHWGLYVVTIVTSVVIFCTIGKNQIIHNIDLVKLDYAKWNKSEIEYIIQGQKIADLAPEPLLMEDVALALYSRGMVAESEEYRTLSFKGARELLTQAQALHPYRITIRSRLALLSILEGDLQRGEEHLTAAFTLSNNRWTHYRLQSIAVSYLKERGRQMWYQERRPFEAMAYFLEAKKYLAISRDYPAEAKKSIAEEIDGYIQILEKGEVTPAEGIIFFNGYGLR